MIHRTRTSCGFTLLEVLIAILVVSFGLLGLAALQAFSIKANQSASFRTQATALANMIVERMRAHGGGALNTLAAYSGTGGDVQGVQDIAAWQAAIRSQLPGGAGTIQMQPFVGPSAPVILRISITWTDARWAIVADQQTDFHIDIAL